MRAQLDGAFAEVVDDLQLLLGRQARWFAVGSGGIGRACPTTIVHARRCAVAVGALGAQPRHIGLDALRGERVGGGSLGIELRLGKGPVSELRRAAVQRVFRHKHRDGEGGVWAEARVATTRETARELRQGRCTGKAGLAERAGGHSRHQPVTTLWFDLIGSVLSASNNESAV